LKLLLDTCVWGGALPIFQSAGHDAVWCGQWQNDPGDVEILQTAFLQGRVLVTLDKDFGELAIVRGSRHCGIVRLANIAATEQANALLKVLELYGSELDRGAIITVEPGRLRIRLETKE
jgi:predicted nuclease of predicted toxin-antitoxin system